MKYMQGLNQWLERDVHERQSEVRGVLEQVDRLRDDVQGISLHGRRRSSFSSVS